MPNKWLAGFLGLFFQPFAFIYLSRFKLAGIYFVAVLGTNLVDFYVLDYFGIPGLVLSIYCAYHAFTLAKETTFPEKRKWHNYWYFGLGLPVFILGVLLSSRAFVWDFYTVPAGSMSPSINVGDFVFVSKWGYGNYGLSGMPVYSAPLAGRDKPHRGEIFTFIGPAHDAIFVKRIVGLPGDRIVFDDMTLTINGVAYPAIYIAGEKRYVEDLGSGDYKVQYSPVGNRYRNFEVVVPDDSYFAMGDNRDNSLDSRAWGPVPAANIIGRVVAIW